MPEEQSVELAEKQRQALRTQPLKSAANVQTLLDSYTDSFAKVAPRTLDVERMMRIAVMIASRQPKLREATGLSLLGALMTATQMGLDIGMGLAHLVPFYNKDTRQTDIQLIPDYKGLIELVTNTGRVTNVRAVPVFTDDVFDYEEGVEPKLVHKPKTRSLNPADLVAVYSVARYADGFMDVELMFKNEIDRIKDRSKSKTGPWTTDYIEMAKKTVIKRHCKRLPKSVELVTAIALDDAASMGAPQRIQLTEKAGGELSVDVIPPDIPDAEPEAGEPAKADKNRGKLDIAQAKAGNQERPSKVRKKPEPEQEALIGETKQKRFVESAIEVGFTPAELVEFLHGKGIPDGDVKNIPAARYDDLLMKLASGGDPEPEETQEPETTAEPEADPGPMASDEDWKQIYQAADLAKLKRTNLLDWVREQGWGPDKLPADKVVEVLRWILTVRKK